MSSIFEKKFNEELLSMIGKKVKVVAESGEESGTFLAADSNLNIILETKIEGGIKKIVYSSKEIRKIVLLEEPFDLKALADRLNRVFPGLVKLREDIEAIIIMDKIKVTKTGVVEGSGPSADKVKQVYDSYLQELSSKK
ncbi:MAG: Lsm family RNA-binding protein [Nitrososphaerota archaeon]|nr:Lsm family RNA-binding protein [Nitrososphaerota archaeon]MDG6932548.1 Lsm family RNA-binding protein [Nitrososphaerota archaeon]MDG6935273.1 Lsm family RNA-binding protein [Nitrososphaerota archaeon]MDG6943664.1 Lsm family RNA-binding protein [Nitrososphaerota archaeon]